MIEIIGFIGIILAGGGFLALIALFFFDAAIDFVGWAIGSMLLGLALAVPAIVKIEDDKEAAFMAACTQDRKEYECTAMWRSGGTRVAPMPVIIPVR